MVLVLHAFYRYLHTSHGFISGEHLKFAEFKATWAADGKPGTSGNLRYNTIMSGLTFYLYNEVSTFALKSLSGVSHSVANTAKRVIVMVYMAAVTGKALTEEQKTGAAIAITGVLIYSVIDDLLKAMKAKPKAA